MPIYEENPLMLNLELSDTDNEVRIRVDCFNGTIGMVSPCHLNGKIIKCEGERAIGKAKDLKGQTCRINGDGNNPDNGNIRVRHTIFEVDGKMLTYTFPDDYKGKPEYNINDKHPDYKFYINFK